MAAGEIYLKSTSPSFLYFRDSNDVEVSISGSTISTTASPGEVFARFDAGVPYIYWSVNGTTVYRAQLFDRGAASEPVGSLWVSSGGIKLFNISLGGITRSVPFDSSGFFDAGSFRIGRVRWASTLTSFCGDESIIQTCSFGIDFSGFIGTRCGRTVYSNASCSAPPPEPEPTEDPGPGPLPTSTPPPYVGNCAGSSSGGVISCDTTSAPSYCDGFEDFSPCIILR